MTMIARAVFRIGVQTLWRDGDRWYVSLENRTYRSRVEIPATRAEAWRRALTRDPVQEDHR